MPDPGREYASIAEEARDLFAEYVVGHPATTREIAHAEMQVCAVLAERYHVGPGGVVRVVNLRIENVPDPSGVLNVCTLVFDDVVIESGRRV